MISSKIDPSILPKQTGGLKAERTFHRVTFTPSSANPGETLYVSVPTLSENLLLVPSTLALRFDLAIQPQTADKRYCVNNVGRNIVNRIKVKFAGECLLDLNRYDLYHTYKDLFMWPKERDLLIEQGVGSADLRKIRSKIVTASEPSNATDEKALLTAYGTKYVIPLDFEILKNHGVFYPRILGAEMQFEVTLADTTNILQQDTAESALSGAIHPYSLTNLELQYETIHSDVLARSAMAEYSAGKAFLYDHVHHHKTINFLDKTDDLITETVNIPRRSLSGLLLLFVKPFSAGKRDSEAFHNPNITDVKVNINGVPNKIYSQGLKPADIYKEVVKRFGDHISPTQFFHGNKYALWIDLRTTDDNDIHGQGLKLVSTQDGVTLEIKRTKNSGAGATDKINCHIFVVSDAQMNIEGNQLSAIAY